MGYISCRYLVKYYDRYYHTDSLNDANRCADYMSFCFGYAEVIDNDTGETISEYKREEDF